MGCAGVLCYCLLYCVSYIESYDDVFFSPTAVPVQRSIIYCFGQVFRLCHAGQCTDCVYVCIFYAAPGLAFLWLSFEMVKRIDESILCKNVRSGLHCVPWQK